MKVDSRQAITERRVEAPQPQRQMRRWEYRSQEMDRAADISQFGAEGWECFSVLAAAPDRAVFYFRRSM